MLPIVFAATEEAEAAGISAIGLSPSAFAIQLISFVIVLFILNKFAFKPIGKKLEERRRVIEDGVKLGQKLERRQAKVEEEISKILKDARKDADKIIATAHKEAREISRDAEKAASKKAEVMMNDAEARIEEESNRARKRLEKDIVALISEATEALVGEKVDAKKDAELIDKILRGRIKK